MNNRTQSNAGGCILVVIIGLIVLLYAINRTPEDKRRIDAIEQ